MTTDRMTDELEILTSKRNPLVKQLRLLHRTQGRSAAETLLLEGTHLLEAAVQADYPLDVVCYTLDWAQRYGALAAAIAPRAKRWVAVSEAVLAAIATTQTPDGIVATAPRHPPRTPQLPCSLGVAVETLQDPGNLGTILRTAAATNVDGLWLTQDSVAFDHPKVLRASAGQWFQMPMAVNSDLLTPLRAAKAVGVQVVATLPTATQAHWEVDWTRPSLIVLGNEGAGLSAEVAAIADVGVRIPLWRAVESLNVAISLAVILYEAQRQRSLK